jgi:hypothetical protein
LNQKFHYLESKSGIPGLGGPALRLRFGEDVFVKLNVAAAKSYRCDPVYFTRDSSSLVSSL